MTELKLTGDWVPPGIGLETLVLAHALVESTELFYDNIIAYIGSREACCIKKEHLRVTELKLTGDWVPPGIGLETLVLAHALVESTELFYDNIIAYIGSREACCIIKNICG